MGFGINHTLDESGRIVQQERESIRRKACREDMRNIAQRKVIKSESSRRVGAVICDCPGLDRKLKVLQKNVEMNSNELLPGK